MLKKLRKKKTAKRIWILLAILILPAFLLWGLGGGIRSQKQPQYAGKIADRKISFLEYKGALEATKNQAIIQFGDNLPEIQKYLNLESQAWDRLLLLAEARKRKINVSDKEVIELIRSYPFFQRKGKFDNATYFQMLQYVFRAQPRLFEEHARQNLILSKLYKELTSGISLNTEEVKEAYRKENEQISIYYIAGLYSDFAKDTTSPDENIKDYFTKNSLQFKQPLSFNIEYIALESEDKMRGLVLRLNKKEDFAKVAKDFGVAVKETGLFNQNDPIPGIGWAPQILNLLSGLKIGQFLSPVKIDNSYHMLRLKEKKEPYIPDYEAIKDKVKEAFIKNKTQRMAKEKIEDCLKKLNEAYKVNPKAIDFANMAKEYGLKSDSTQVFKYGSYIEGIGASDNFFTAAGNLKENEASEIIEMPSGFYIIKLKSRIQIDEKKFETEKTEFSQRLLFQKKQEYFNKFVEELRKNLQLL